MGDTMWKSVCCEIQGRGHKKNNVPCQDKTFELAQNGIHVIALADGAGSASLSHYGAERVVHVVSKYIVEHFQECLNDDDGLKFKESILKTIQTSLLKEAQTHKCSIRDLSSTLLLAAVNDNNFILVHIGDGVIGYLDGDKLKIASLPDNGEFSNETIFVTSREAIVSMRIFKGALKNIDGFVLMSDGTEQSLYHKQSKTLARVIIKLMQRTILIDSAVFKVELHNAFTSVISKNTQDDCSIAILARPSKILSSIDALDLKEKQELYRIKEGRHCTYKRVNRYDAILAITETPSSIRRIAKNIHLKPKYTKKHLDKLISLGIIIKKDKLYIRV